MGARDPHIAKYVAPYQALFPPTPILLLRSEPSHFLHPRGTARDFAPAIPFVRSIFPELGKTTPTSTTSARSQPPQLLIHAWSNGGTTCLLNLRRALGGTTTTLPPYTLVLDSTPGTFRYRSSYLAFTTGMKGAVKWLVAPLMHLLCAWYWFVHVLIRRGQTGLLARMARALNDDASKAAEVRRTYVYGEGDRLVDWRDVEGHAEEAARKGFAVRREKFEGGEHVAHVRIDPERYWRVVRETWEGVA
jgi:hypothetical protein